MGEPIQIISFDHEGKLKLNEKGLDKIFNQDDELRKLPIVVLTAVGPFRSGKSFLLSWLVRYFKADVKVYNYFKWNAAIIWTTLLILSFNIMLDRL